METRKSLLSMAVMLSAALLLATGPACGQRAVRKPAKPASKAPVKPQTKAQAAATADTTTALVSPPTGYANGHGWVDLGMGMMWAYCNIGADSPEQYGDYFSWGATSPVKYYDLETCPTSEKVMVDISGNPEYDAARANWGGQWRMPTQQEMDLMQYGCDQKWTCIKGVWGLLFTSRLNGNSIFMPASGCRMKEELFGTGTYGQYWSSTPVENNKDFSYQFYVYKSGCYGKLTWRSHGQAVRPIMGSFEDFVKERERQRNKKREMYMK